MENIPPNTSSSTFLPREQQVEDNEILKEKREQFSVSLRKEKRF